MEPEWADKTSVGFVLDQRVDASTTRVFRVKTQSSNYVLGFFALDTTRPFALMRGLSKGIGHEIDLRDAAPRIGDHSLFELPPDQWVGLRIDMAGTTTSTVASAAEETNPEHSQTIVRTLLQPVPVAPAARRSAPPASADSPPPRSPPRQEPPYPENLVEYVEILASVLRSLASNATAMEDIRRQPRLNARLKVALMNARVAGEDVATAL